jgi:hypothetical protein
MLELCDLDQRDKDILKLCDLDHKDKDKDHINNHIFSLHILAILEIQQKQNLV